MKPIETHEKKIEAPKQPWQTPRLRSLNERHTDSPGATYFYVTEWHYSYPFPPYIPSSTSFGPS